MTYLLPDEYNRPPRWKTVINAISGAIVLFGFSTMLGYAMARLVDVTMGGAQ